MEIVNVRMRPHHLEPLEAGRAKQHATRDGGPHPQRDRKRARRAQPDAEGGDAHAHNGRCPPQRHEHAAPRDVAVVVSRRVGPRRCFRLSGVLGGHVGGLTLICGGRGRWDLTPGRHPDVTVSPIHQLVHRAAKQAAEPHHLLQLRTALARLPLRDGLTADAQALGEGRLAHAVRNPLALNAVSHAVHAPPLARRAFVVAYAHRIVRQSLHGPLPLSISILTPSTRLPQPTAGRFLSAHASTTG